MSNHRETQNQTPPAEPAQQPEKPQEPGEGGSWVFSQRPQGSDSGYSSKYAYSSFENVQSQRKNEQAAGSPYDKEAYEAAKQDQSYRWNYDDYQSASSPKPKRQRGLRVFGLIVGSVLFLNVLFLAGYGLYALVKPSAASSSIQEASIEPLLDSAPSSSPAEEKLAAAEPSSSLPTHSLILGDKPREETEILSGGKLPIPQRVELVKSSVVAVVNYQQKDSQSLFTVQSQGSGIIFSEDGYIITTSHVVADAGSLKVLLYSGEEYAAQVVGCDENSDLAVIRVEAQGLSPANFGNSEQVDLGEQVIAVGNPTGQRQGSTLTVGYVSALNRHSSDSSLSYIQTDAPMPVGSCGGALANEYGQVVGINTALHGDSAGLSLALSINDAQPIIEQLLQEGDLPQRPRLGINGYEMDSFSAQLNSLPQGFVVTAVDSGSPAEVAGLRPRDVITAVDGVSVLEEADIEALLLDKELGDQLTITLFRRGQSSSKQLNIQLTLTEILPQQEPSLQEQKEAEDGASPSTEEQVTLPFIFFQ